MKIVTLILIVSVLSGCSSSSKKTVENLYYRFPDSSIQRVEGLNVDVKRPSALGILGNRPMVAETSGAGLVQMSNNFWLDSPKVLLRNYLQKVFVKNNDKEKIILNSQILALEKKQNQAVLAIKFTLMSAENNLIFDKTYKNQREITDNSIAHFSSAIGDLLEKMVEQFTRDIQ